MTEPVPIPTPALTYTDQVLSSLVTVALEDAASAEVDALATFAPPWRERLIVLKAYLLVCLEYASASDDPFTLKLGQYQGQYDTALSDARAAVQKAAMTAGLFAIPLERG